MPWPFFVEENTTKNFSGNRSILQRGRNDQQHRIIGQKQEVQNVANAVMPAKTLAVDHERDFIGSFKAWQPHPGVLFHLLDYNGDRRIGCAEYRLYSSRVSLFGN
jgi:hypothetical protein